MPQVTILPSSTRSTLQSVQQKEGIGDAIRSRVQKSIAPKHPEKTARRTITGIDCIVIVRKLKATNVIASGTNVMEKKVGHSVVDAGHLEQRDTH